jgi:hypothetical protein
MKMTVFGDVVPCSLLPDYMAKHARRQSSSCDVLVEISGS